MANGSCTHLLILAFIFLVALQLGNKCQNNPLVSAKTAGYQFYIKISSYQYRKSYCGDKTVVRLSYLHNGISYTGKMVSLYWIGPVATPVHTWSSRQMKINFRHCSYIVSYCLKPPSTWLFVHQLAEATNKENIKALHTDSWWREIQW